MGRMVVEDRSARRSLPLMVMLSVVLWSCGPAQGADVEGNGVDVGLSGLSGRISFVPLSTPMALGTNTVWDVPKTVMVTNGPFRVSLVGGRYRTEAGPWGKSVFILVPPNDTNVYQFNQVAGFATNLGSFIWTNPFPTISGFVRPGTNVVFGTNNAGGANEQVVVNASASGGGGGTNFVSKDGDTVNGSLSVIGDVIANRFYANTLSSLAYTGHGGGLTNLTGGNVIGAVAEASHATNADYVSGVLSNSISGNAATATTAGSATTATTATTAISATSAITAGTATKASYVGDVSTNVIGESQVTGLVSDLAGKQAGPLTGDVTTSGSVATLATVASPGTATKVTFNGKGLVTSGTTLSAGDVPAIPESGVTSLVSDLAGKQAGPLTGDVTTSGSVATLAAGNAGNLNSGTLGAARLPALSGDITSSAGSAVTTLKTSPTIVTPTIASLVNMNHNHQNSAGGGSLDAAAIGSGTIAAARGGAGTVNGIMKANGSGTVSAAALTDVLTVTPGGLVMTNNNVNAWVIFTNNGVSLSVNASGVLIFTNYSAANQGFTWSTNTVVNGNLTITNATSVGAGQGAKIELFSGTGLNVRVAGGVSVYASGGGGRGFSMTDNDNDGILSTSGSGTGRILISPVVGLANNLSTVLINATNTTTGNLFSTNTIQATNGFILSSNVYPIVTIGGWKSLGNCGCVDWISNNVIYKLCTNAISGVASTNLVLAVP